MRALPLENLRSIPDRRRGEGKLFDLSAVLLHAIAAMAAGDNSCRLTHKHIRARLRPLNEAFGLTPPYSPSYSGLRLIPQGVDSKALETAFGRGVATAD